MKGSTRVRNAVFSAATLLSLGFGAAQAFAAPGAPQQNGAAMACDWNYCYYSCRSQGYMGGFCDTSMGVALCECYG